MPKTYCPEDYKANRREQHIKIVKKYDDSHKAEIAVRKRAQSKKNRELKKYFCECCQIACVSQYALNIHLSTKRHNKKIALLVDKEP
jgi:hypothetical protein